MSSHRGFFLRYDSDMREKENSILVQVTPESFNGSSGYVREDFIKVREE